MTMSFKFFKNGKEITAPRRIKWYFDIMPNSIFESAPDKVETNANFWRKKLNFPKDAEANVIFVASEDYDIEQLNQTNHAPFTNTTANDADNGASNDGPVTEPVVSQDTEVINDTPKRKRKQEAAELPAMPEQLDDADSSASE
jgi:hypothetical protein